MVPWSALLFIFFSNSECMFSCDAAHIFYVFFFRNETTEKDRLFNEIISVLRSHEIGFTSYQTDTVGSMVVTTLTNALWYIGQFHDKLVNRSITLPEMFKTVYGPRDLKKQHKKTPQVKTIFLK